MYSSTHLQCPYCGEKFGLKDNWIGVKSDPMAVCPNCMELVYVGGVFQKTGQNIIDDLEKIDQGR